LHANDLTPCLWPCSLHSVPYSLTSQQRRCTAYGSPLFSSRWQAAAEEVLHHAHRAALGVSTTAGPSMMWARSGGPTTHPAAPGPCSLMPRPLTALIQQRSRHTWSNEQQPTRQHRQRQPHQAGQHNQQEQQPPAQQQPDQQRPDVQQWQVDPFDNIMAKLFHTAGPTAPCRCMWLCLFSPPCLTCMLFLVPCWAWVQLFPVWASRPSLGASYFVHQYIHTLCFPPYTGPRF